MHDSAARLDFSAWVRHDQQQFEQIAGRIMAEMDRTALEAARCAGDDPRQMLTREIFAALLDYCRRHTNDLDPSVEHDIPNWIEGNAAALADAHYQRLHLQEQATPAWAEQEQNDALQAAWATIETRIRAYLNDCHGQHEH